MVQNAERRTYPRITDEKVSLKLRADQFDATISQSLNISASGVYCKVDKDIPLLSRVMIVLMLPVEGAGAKNKMKKIETEGVVVRAHPVIENGKILHYDVAVFFDNLSSRDRENIKEYVSKKTQ
jgi:hypothetical protein